MSRLTAFLAGAYALLLQLYPHDFRDEFGEEMQVTFSDALKEAARHGTIALAQLSWRELRELPVNSVLEYGARFRKGTLGMNAAEHIDSRPLSWFETLIGLLPFFVFGPLNVWLAFPFPYPEGSVARWFFASQTPLFVVGGLAGLAVGWVTGWRRWVFPYLGLGILVSAGWIVSESTRWVYATGLSREIPFIGQVVMTWASFALVVAAFAVVLLAVAVLMRTVGSIRLLYLRLVRDWTQLSFGLSIIAAILLGGVDHEEDRNLTLLLVLPSVAALLTALFYLRSRTPRQRAWMLVFGFALAFALGTARAPYYILYAVILLPIVFVPLLFELLPRQKGPALVE